MPTSEIITSTKYGPAVAVSVIVATNLLLILTAFTCLEPTQAAFLLPTLFTVFLILYRIFLQHNAFLNFQWLKYFRNIEPIVKTELKNPEDGKDTQSFHFWLTVSNNTYHDISSYIIFVYLPKKFLASKRSESRQDHARSTNSHVCLRIPNINEENPQPISKNSTRHINDPLVFLKSQINKEILNESIEYVIVVEGLVAINSKVSLSSLLKLDNNNILSMINGK